MNHTVSSLWAAISLARRDLLEFLRDRRTVAVTLLLPMITYPLVALSSSLGVRTGLQTTAERQSATSLSLVFSGPESPRLATRLGMLLLDAKENFRLGGQVMSSLRLNQLKKQNNYLILEKLIYGLMSLTDLHKNLPRLTRSILLRMFQTNTLQVTRLVNNLNHSWRVLRLRFVRNEWGSQMFH